MTYDLLGALQESIDRAGDAARAVAGVKSVTIPDDKDYILWCSGIDDWQFAYRTDHGWVTRTRREHWDTLISTQSLEKLIPVYSKIIYLRKDES